ncbi:hypothetical protein jhhlp_004071 [Lomentospora prolificans]|uniref:Uncharacterized protein n=1 Tax=Lomentospora prolificans TaxID=41688 RepID=A0A2N3NAH9_9PEZI|nr:hypothetical protein jhhlp_004071 [Lomentospora prolificans]
MSSNQNQNQFHALGGDSQKNEVLRSLETKQSFTDLSNDLQGQKGQQSNQQQQAKPSQEGEFRVQPEPQDISSDFSVYHATPGPAIHKDLDVPEEGTKEERRAKAAEWNQK